jgi:hypothetical protein
MRAVAAALAVVGVGVLVVAAPVSAGTPAMSPAGGVIKIFSKASNTPVAPILITGAIGDYGKSVTMDKDGKPDNNGNYVKVGLRKGTFEVNATQLNAVTNHATPTVNTTTCSFSFSGTGPVTLFNGTGLYAGISGTARITVSFAVIGPSYTSGPKKGQCNMRENIQPLAQYGTVTGTGLVKFS